MNIAGEHPHAHQHTDMIQAASCGLLCISRDALERAAELNPAHPLTLERLLDVVLVAGDRSAAQTVLQQMLAADASHPWASTLLHTLQHGDEYVCLTAVTAATSPMQSIRTPNAP